MLKSASTFVPNKSSDYHKKKKPLDFRIKIWRSIRQPFVFPVGLQGHKCSNWEIFDADMAGCLDCGFVHHCLDESTCTLSEENDSKVCIITGNCVKKKFFPMDEFMDNMLLDEDILVCNGRNKDFLKKAVDSKSERSYKYEDVQKCINWILASATCKQSYLQEKSRMQAKHRQVLWKLLKDFKIKNPNKVPRMCTIVAKMLFQCNKIRICCPDWNEDLRKRIAASSTEYIIRFLNMLSQKFRPQLSLFKNNILFIGIVYLMRMGITMQNVILLPKIHELQYLLPIEAHLKFYFKIKCKFITEVENLIKMCIRNLTNQEIEQMGFTSVDINY